jgi:hypothetical protein
MELSKIIDFDSIDVSDLSELSVLYDSTHTPNSFVFNHIINSNQIAIDCVKWYNRIWSIRQNVNLYIATANKDADIEISFNDIHYAFGDTKKAKQKDFLLQNVHFLRYVKRMNHNISCRFDDTTFVFNPSFYVTYEVPLKSGSSECALSKEDVIKFICFLIIYGTQSLLIVTKHFKYKDKTPKINQYNCHFDISFHNSLRSSGNFNIDKKYIYDKIVSLDIGANYKKFFEG